MNKKILIWIVMGVLLIGSVSAAFQQSYRENQFLDFINENTNNFEPDLEVVDTWRADGLIHLTYEYDFYDFTGESVVRVRKSSEYSHNPPLYVNEDPTVNRNKFNDFVANHTVSERGQLKLLQKHVERKTQPRDEMDEEEEEQTFWDWFREALGL